MIFVYLFATFIVQNLKKFLEPIQSYQDTPFLDPKWSICLNNFLEKSWSFSSIYLALFIVQILKNSYNKSSYVDEPFLSPKWGICPEQKFFL